MVIGPPLLAWRTLKGFYLMQDVKQIRTTCILQDITPGIYTIEVNKLSILESWLDLCVCLSDAHMSRTQVSFFPCQLKDDANVTRRQTQYHVSQGEMSNLYFC